MPNAAAPWPVSLHVALAFVNILLAAVLGILLGLDRTRALLGVSPLAMMFAHAHLAAVGWATMMVVGLSYRLIPMILPARMPTGTSPRGERAVDGERPHRPGGHAARGAVSRPARRPPDHGGPRRFRHPDPADPEAQAAASAGAPEPRERFRTMVTPARRSSGSASASVSARALRP